MSAATEPCTDVRYLSGPPEACGAAPLATRPQLLPLGSLLPKDFERLCFRLARLNASVELCRFYGVHGQPQQGIDLYARKRDGSYMVVQCKRSSDDFTPGEITDAVDRFLVGDWADSAAVFVLAVTANLEATQLADRIEDERPKLTKRGIEFQVWDETEISAMMKDHPRLVDDFFGREAVKIFLGPEVSESLGDRLDADEVINFRVELGALYREVFGRLERGIHGDERNVALAERFVLPDVLSATDTVTAAPAFDISRREGDETAVGLRRVARRYPDVAASLRNPQFAPSEPRPMPDLYASRVKVTDWLSTGTWHVVVGVPGAGKSALLRSLVLDVFADEPRFIAGVDRLHDVLPVWLPFAFWTRVARTRSDAASVLDAVHEWLDAYDHGHLWPMIEKALRDERVLLVVDGLDEWASPDLARLCVDRLEVFAGTKHVSVLASSRPFSTTELPLDGQRWRRGELAPLDQDQRRTFIVKWLAPVIAEPELSKEASSWANEIDSAVHLRELSDLPLFLVLLLRTREQLTEFPEDLYAVLTEAVTRLVGEHRRRKIDVAVAADAFPSTGDVRKISAATAEHMHLGSTLSIADDDLRELFRRTLTDAIGYPAAQAHTMALALVNSLSPGVGLMIRPAPDETRFFHRSVLEFLAAERMLAKPGPEQIALFQEHITDRRWSQVLRFLIRGLARPREIAAIFDALDIASANDSLLREHLDLLAVDVAVTAGQADAATRRRLLDGVIREIEAGERIPHRAHLIDRLVVGLARPEIHGELLDRFEGWLRAVPRQMWSAVLDTASNWEQDDLLLDMLWHALISDNDQVHRVASCVLGKQFAGVGAVAERLAELAKKTRLPHRRAAATEALSLGWPQHPALDGLIISGRNHTDFAVRHTAIAADLRRGNPTEINRSALIELLDHAPTITAWSDGLIDLMFTYYPDDQVIFQHYAPLADPTTTDQFRQGTVPAMYLILKAYTSRSKAKEVFLKFIAADRRDFPDTPSNLIDNVPWKEIGQVYGTDDEVVAAVERLVDEFPSNLSHSYEIYFCSQVARTEKLRSRLIASIESRRDYGIGWAIRALLEAWPDDPDVQHALSRLMDPTVGEVPDGAIWYLPDIITDPGNAFKLLTTIAPTADHQGAVIHALDKLVEHGGLRTDPRTTVMLERALRHEMSNSWTSPEAALYACFPDYPGVRNLALARLDDRDTPLDRMAYGFRADQQMREHIACRLKPLSPPLRGRLVEGLAEAALTDRRTTMLLGRYDIEPDPTVKLIAAIAYAERLIATDTVTDEVIDVMTEQARATGHDHAERRGAAFAALARLGRLDKLTDLQDRFGQELPTRIQHSHLGGSALFYRIVCRHWDGIKAALGQDFAQRFGFGNTTEFWQNILAVAYDYPTTYADLTALLEQQPTLAASAAGVTYLSRTEPASDRLWESTTTLLRRTHTGAYVDIQPAWPALNVLEDQFADDPRTSRWLDAEFAPVTQPAAISGGLAIFIPPSFGAVAAIARLRPTDPAIQELLTQAQRVEGQPWHAFHEWTELAAAATQDAREFVNLAVEISRIVRVNDMFPEYIHRPLAARLRRDAALAAAVAELVPSLSGAAFGIVLRLLALSARLDGPLVSYLRAHMSTPSDEETDTFDPLVGQATHRELLILDLLDTVEI